jgi:trehalose-6-phosphatase
VKSAASALADEIARAARRRGAARALILDLDGTLAPITEHRRRARVPAAVLNALSRLLDDGWRVAIVSGRPVADARRMVPLSGVSIFGSHGIERSTARAVPRRLRAIARRAAQIARQARVWFRAFSGVEIERKPLASPFTTALESKARTGSSPPASVAQTARHAGIRVAPRKARRRAAPAGKGLLRAGGPPRRARPGTAPSWRSATTARTKTSSRRSPGAD